MPWDRKGGRSLRFIMDRICNNNMPIIVSREELRGGVTRASHCELRVRRRNMLAT